MHRVCLESQAAASLYSKVTVPVQDMVVGDVTWLRIRHLRSDNDELLDISRQGIQESSVTELSFLKDRTVNYAVEEMCYKHA